MAVRTLEDADREIADLKAIIEHLRTEFAALKLENAELRLEIAALKDEKSKNSKNSHLPPSSERPGQQRGKKGKSGLRRGGQPGHGGKRRSLVPPEKVDHFKDVFPTRCAECDHGLLEIFDAGHGRHQVTELPPVTAEVTEYRTHAVRCPRCRAETRAQLDKSVACSSFGPRLSAVIGMLIGVYHLSRRNTRKLLLDLLEIRMSLGAVSNIEARVSLSLASASDEAMAQVQQAPVKHTDGTGWRQAGQGLQLWTIATQGATVFRVLKDGSRASIQAMFAMFTGFLISDRATALHFWDMAKRQICWAHLLRKFIFFSERDDDRGKHGKALLEYAGLAFSYWHQFKDGQIDRELLIQRMKPVREQFESLLKKGAASKLLGLAGSCADILEHKVALWTYLTEHNVEPTNNHAEQQLRGFVIWKKLCFGSQSERGNRFAERLMTVAGTARKQRVALLPFLIESYRAHLHGGPAPSLISR